MGHTKFQINSLRYAIDKKYRNEFIKKFNYYLNRKVEIKKSIQKIIDNDFDVESVANLEHCFILPYEIDRTKDDKINIITFTFFLYKENETIRNNIDCIFIKVKRKWILKNKNEVRKKFYEELVLNEYGIAFDETLLKRMEAFKNIVLDEREKLKGIPESSIMNVQKIFFDNAVKIVENLDNYELLFSFTDYIINNNNNIKSPSDFYSFIAEKRERNKNLKEKTRLQLEDAVRKRYTRYEKKNLVPSLSDILSTG